MAERPSLADARRLVDAEPDRLLLPLFADDPEDVRVNYDGVIGTQMVRRARALALLSASSDLLPALLEVVDAVEDFIAHMTALDRGRITGREVAGYLRRAITEYVSIEGENR